MYKNGKICKKLFMTCRAELINHESPYDKERECKSCMIISVIKKGNACMNITVVGLKM